MKGTGEFSTANGEERGIGSFCNGARKMGFAGPRRSVKEDAFWGL